MNIERPGRIPRRLLALECAGTSLMIVGVIESFGLQLLMPAALRFDGYGFVLMLLGMLLVLPLMHYLTRLQPQTAGGPRRPY